MTDDESPKDDTYRFSTVPTADELKVIFRGAVLRGSIKRLLIKYDNLATDKRRKLLPEREEARECLRELCRRYWVPKPEYLNFFESKIKDLEKSINPSAK